MPPGNRQLILSKVDEGIEVEGRNYSLYTNVCENNISDGYKNLVSFEKEYIPVFTYQVEDINAVSYTHLVERVYNELSKALLTDKPSRFFDVLKEANVLDIHFKEIYDLIGAEQPPKYHPEGDSYNLSLIHIYNVRRAV